MARAPQKKKASPKPSADDISVFLMAAFDGDHVAMIAFLDEFGLSAINAKDEYGETALMHAAHGDETSSVKLLLEKGADPNLKNSFKETALIFAAYDGSYATFEALINGGANPSLKNNDGDTVLDLARMYSKDEKVIALLENAVKSRKNKSVDKKEDARVIAKTTEHTEQAKQLHPKITLKRKP